MCPNDTGFENMPPESYVPLFLPLGYARGTRSFPPFINPSLLRTLTNKSQTPKIMAIEDLPKAERSNPNLPPDIITEILLLLPVKSLLQFRSVSKSWRSLISDPKFVKTHLTIYSKDDEIAHHKLIFFSDREGTCGTAMKTCHLSPVLNGFSVNPMELDHPVNPDIYVGILGSINGIICITTFSHVAILWNPSTRISKKLPDSGLKLMALNEERRLYGDLWDDAYFDSEYVIVVGFGYDASTDDYKVVEILCNKATEKFGTEVMVYSSRTGFWTRIGEFPPVRWLDGCSVFVNGAIHWNASEGTKDPFIVSLDLASETFGEIAPPSNGYLSLGVLREGLCVLYGVDGDRTDLWIMKEYGVSESWTKLTSIPYMSSNIRRNPVPLYLSKNGDILLNYGYRIVLYDPQSQSFKNPDICNFGEFAESTTYVESLVSPMIQDGLE